MSASKASGEGLPAWPATAGRPGCSHALVALAECLPRLALQLVGHGCPASALLTPMPVLHTRAPRKLTAGAALLGAVARVVPDLVAGEAAAARLRRGSLGRALLRRRRRQGAARHAGAAVLCPWHTSGFYDAARSQGARRTLYWGTWSDVLAAVMRNLDSCSQGGNDFTAYTRSRKFSSAKHLAKEPQQQELLTWHADEELAHRVVPTPYSNPSTSSQTLDACFPQCLQQHCSFSVLPASAGASLTNGLQSVIAKYDCRPNIHQTCCVGAQHITHVWGFSDKGNVLKSLSRASAPFSPSQQEHQNSTGRMRARAHAKWAMCMQPSLGQWPDLVTRNLEHLSLGISQPSLGHRQDSVTQTFEHLSISISCIAAPLLTSWVAHLHHAQGKSPGLGYACGMRVFCPFSCGELAALWPSVTRPAFSGRLLSSRSADGSGIRSHCAAHRSRVSPPRAWLLLVIIISPRST